MTQLTNSYIKLKIANFEKTNKIPKLNPKTLNLNT